MMPVGFLLREHRIIEKAVLLMNKERNRLLKGGRLNKEFITILADFFKTYADKLHHGKEEDILFRELEKKKISKEHELIMNQLIEEHTLARKTVSALLNSKSSKEAADNMKLLIDLYPKHIRVEDKDFFFQAMKYFTQDEQQCMHDESVKFDREFVHKKYKDLLESL